MKPIENLNFFFKNEKHEKVQLKKTFSKNLKK